ncbi:MAG: DNA helicase RecG [Verrucomicrobia bacterium]|nr:MAG: DNA helicase RecG [Verrucomicrobiota bacterium]PYK90458.1 MAG: DNA helicase RecG [Verrucomicrobiota bacterium]PYL29113.1 MAG: DNA helicase RecG [Verrucomicrobiota bacterium]
MEISQPLEELDWIPRPKILALRRLGITTVEHLLTHFPRRHEDRSAFPEFPRDESDVPICLSGEVIKTSLRRFGGWKKIFEATLQELNANALSQPLICRWFNLHYVQKMIATGQQLVVFGKPRLRGKRICMDHPEFEVIENNEERSIHLRRITPIYPATEGLSQRALRSMIYRLLQELDTEPIEPLLPENLKNGDRGEAIRAIHFPETWQSLNVAREHLVLSEFFAMQMLIASRRTDSHARVSAAHCGRGELMQKFLHALPFELTTAQKKVIAEIQSDLAAKYPMNRLLQGDVGSGKTVVAIAAILLAVEAGYQAAFMAPTQVLAEQHYTVLRRWLEPLGVKLSIRTAARQEESFLPLVEGNENADVIIGTHALLYEKVSFSNLGLAVIDEQHKFGVAQRARLTSREPTPDVLVMTATPIPRTVTMTVYGDLDVSVLDEMPRGRGKVVTAVRDSSKLGEVLTFFRTQLEAGRQLYVVYPLIEESEKLEAKAAAAEYERWHERLHPYSCELLHGRIPGPEKQEIMERFRRGETKVLISTTVIEVGVDVSNANVMLIENAERFGLAQLHQLRGRIGRGEHKSYCILLTSEPSSEAAAKLAVLEKTSDGFEVAEADWELRGPGDLLGTAQSGLPALKIGNLKRDAELMRRARAAAMSIFAADPRLESGQNQRFQQLIVEQQGRTFSNVS